MTPKEKAQELTQRYFDEPTEHMMWNQAQLCAIIAVNEIIGSLENFGYQGAMYDDYFTGDITYTDEKNPSDYWREVITELEK